MALFNKFFQSNKRKNADKRPFSSSQSTNECIFPFSGEQVRVLLFRECDWTGRRLLFDSSAVQKIQISNGQSNDENSKLPPANAFIEICNGYGYTYNPTACESNSIGEMVFGSVAMSFKGTSLKVHWLREPTRILCSQVFHSPIQRRSSFSRGSAASSDQMSKDTVDSASNSFSLSLSLCINDKSAVKPSMTTIPLNVPSSLENSCSAFSGCDSGYSGTDLWAAGSSSSCRSSVASMFSTDPSIAGKRKLSVDSAILVDAAMNGRSSDGCLQRRILRNMSTSFENNLSRNDFIGYFDESLNDNQSSASIPNSKTRRHSEQIESKSNPEMVRRRKNGSKESLKPPHIHFSSYTPRPKATQRRSKIGLAVCIRFSENVEDEMQLFCSEHIALLESMLCRLRAAAETAYLNQKKFHQLMLQAWFSTTSWLTDLFTAPRIQEPVWFSLSNGHTERPNNLAKHFMTELCWLLNSADTKDTNFFVSTLLTAILTNHLGWVSTVAPISSSNLDPVITIHQNQAKMSEISKFHPYNVLWAQLGDLYGSIGNPSRLAKTIVCGAHAATLNKVLNVLTHFVRCGEIQRVNSTKQLDKEEIEDVISGKKRTEFSNHTVVLEGNGLHRTKTGLGDIVNVCIEQPTLNNLQPDFDQSPIIQTNGYQPIVSKSSAIKLMVTSPNNDRFEYETAAEAIDFVLKKVETVVENRNSLNKIKSDEPSENKRRRSLWSIDTVTEGISIELRDSDSVDETDHVSGKVVDLKRSQSLKSKPNTMSGLRRAKTFRELKDSDAQNGNESQVIPYMNSENNNEMDSICASMNGMNFDKDVVDGEQKPAGNVVFVLGDNDVLSGLKTPTPSPVPSKSATPVMEFDKNDNHAQISEPQAINGTQANGKQTNELPSLTPAKTEKKKKHCTHKKHSGVKFNFEQYPQIVTNYMKNKNLDIANYDFLEKGLKMEQENAFNYGASSTSFLPISAPEDTQETDEQEEEEQCECCANTFRILQTPSNATELEFSDDSVYPVPMKNTIPKKLGTVIENETSQDDSDSEQTSQNDIETDVVEKSDAEEKKKEEEKEKEENGEKLQLAKKSNALQVITLPIPRTEILNDEKKQRIRPVYVPSLFVGITDHFIPDMVLQGINAPPHKWEPILKQSLTLASHCATFEQIPTENIAIIANIDKWDVKLVSSQTCTLSTSGLSGPIGMSQLVSTMLETVHAMWSAGTSAHQCMSFLESKLKEIYLQSETLAAFLLATEFCSLNTVTDTLNLSANDVPLLLSVASIHSPQVTKRYGISFR